MSQSCLINSLLDIPNKIYAKLLFKTLEGAVRLSQWALNSRCMFNTEIETYSKNCIANELIINVSKTLVLVFSKQILSENTLEVVAQQSAIGGS